jgi:uncharacterized protein YunC (DUF1805 family)
MWRDVRKHEHVDGQAFDWMSDAELREFVAAEAQALGIPVSMNGRGEGTKH